MSAWPCIGQCTPRKPTAIARVRPIHRSAARECDSGVRVGLGPMLGVQIRSTAVSFTPLPLHPQVNDGIADEGVACIRHADGRLVCEAIPSGEYDVKAAPQAWEGRAYCSIDAATSQKQCVTYCMQTPEGHLVCTGVEEGRYKVTAASDADVEQLVHHIWCTTTYSEDEDEDMVEAGVAAGVAHR